MARYRKIDTRIWNDAKFNALSERGKLVYFFLLTHPNLTMLGAMRATIPGLTAELGMTTEAFAEAFREVLAKAMGKQDEKASFFWLPNFLKYNRPESPNVVKSWPDAFDLLPECQLKVELFQHLKAFTEGLSKGFQEAFTEAFAKDFAKGMPNQEQEQEQEQEQKQEILSSTSSQVDSDESTDSNSSSQRKEEAEIVACVFIYYCEKLGRDLRRYTLTDERRKKALLRLRERRKIHGDLRAAEADLRKAIENLASSEYHVTNGYVDWIEQIFRSTEEFEKRLSWVTAEPSGKPLQAAASLKPPFEHRSTSLSMAEIRARGGIQ